VNTAAVTITVTAAAPADVVVATAPVSNDAAGLDGDMEIWQ